MKAKALRIRNAIFWILIAIFAAMFATISGLGRQWGPKLPSCTIIYIAGIFLILAVVLVVLTVKLKEQGIRKFFFILTGASAAGITSCIMLHNLIYALCIMWFGRNFWGKGGDEAVFFILAVFVMPALFVVGSLGSIVLLMSARSKKRILI